MNRDLAPIVLFTYNRSWHTEQTLEALMKNELANQSSLYIYSDGPKGGASLEDISEINRVRSLIRKKKWCKEVIIIERENNLGLANSIIDGVTEVINDHGKVIVLEDDIVTGKYFLKFMNAALNIYQTEKLLYGVSGYQFSPSRKINQSTYFLPIMSSWGFGTWIDRWNKINFSGEELLEIIESRNIGNRINFGNINYLQMLKDQINKSNDSWAVRFYISMYLENGLFLYPNKSLILNIGFDGTGIHSGTKPSSHYLISKDINAMIPLKKSKIFLNKSLVSNSEKGTFQLLKHKKKGLRKILKSILPPELIQILKRKFKKQTSLETEKSFPRYTEKSIQFEGQEIFVPDIASFNFMKKEIFENKIYNFSSQNVSPYIIDGGANIGLSIIYFKKIYPDSNIVAFEPDPHIFKILKKNIAKYNFRDIELVNKGLWNEMKDLEFLSEGADAGFIPQTKDSKESTIKIGTTSLNYCLKNCEVDFLKLDIEGAETIVLKDIQPNLDKVKRIFIEYHSFVNQPQSINEILNILIEAGFRLHINSPGLYSQSPFVQLNIYNNMDMQLNIYGSKEKFG